MHWIIATLASAFFLGCYELFTKHAVRDNAVLPVLFLTNVCSAVVWMLLMAGHAAAAGVFPDALIVAPLTLWQHELIAFKSLIVATSWVATYFAVKHLPVSISSPVRATGPLWTLLGALAILAERPTGLELLGIATTLASFIGLSFAGRHDGIHFHRDKWISWLVIGTILNGASALYDKYLLGRVGFSPATVQAWFSIYLSLLCLPLAVGWKFRWWPRHVFHWRWSIVFLSFSLLIADFIYFGALRDPHALISLVASLRRGSTLVAFAGGLFFFGEQNGYRKLPAVLGVLAGITLMLLG
ncbi:MAG: DMT family transporter [Verrucomicrobiota bacterium]|nr:DMT family transporter [Verrucomicrobiota bacterium]